LSGKPEKRVKKGFLETGGRKRPTGKKKEGVRRNKVALGLAIVKRKEVFAIQGLGVGIDRKCW